MTPTAPPVSDSLACAPLLCLMGKQGRERVGGVTEAQGRRPSRDLLAPSWALEGVLGGAAEGHHRQSWRQTCEADADQFVLVRRACFLRPEPNVTLGVFPGLAMGTGRGTEDGLCPGFYGETAGPKKDWSSWALAATAEGRMTACLPWLPGAPLPLLCLRACRCQRAPIWHL